MTLSDIALAGFTSSASQGFKIPSSNNLTPLGDVNEDGVDDFGVATNGVFTFVWGRNGGFNADLNINSISVPSEGIKVTSSQISGQIRTDFNYLTGSSFAAADIDKDGLLDLVMVNAQKDGFLIPGLGANMTSNIDLDVPSSSFTRFISPVNCPFGNTLALLDFDQNGWIDIAFSSPRAGSTHKGAVYVMLNELNAFSSVNVTMGTLNASSSLPKMITIGNGQDNDQIGVVIANLNDLTNDTYPELGIGAPLATNGGLSTGKVLVINGSPNPTDINVATFSPTKGSLLIGAQDSAYFGHSISPTKDFNNDELNDFAVGSVKASPINTRGDSGQVDVILGKSGGIPNIDFSSNPPAEQFSRFIGDYIDIQCGASLGLMVNPDGTPILLMGCPNQQYEMNNFAKIKAVIGANGTYPTTDLADLVDPYGFSITGPSRGDHSGYAVGSLGYISNASYPCYYVTTAIGAFVLNGFDAVSPNIMPTTTTRTMSTSTTTSSTALPTPAPSPTGGVTSDASHFAVTDVLWYSALITLAVSSDIMVASGMLAIGVVAKEGSEYIVKMMHDEPGQSLLSELEVPNDYC